MHPIVIFDGNCNFCNNSVNFIIRNDDAREFRFAALQSVPGQRLLAERGLPNGGIGSIILLEDDEVHTHTEASLRIARRLGPPWSWSVAFRIVPRFVRDAVYKLFARNRHRLFGRRDECMVPNAEIKERFLD